MQIFELEHLKELVKHKKHLKSANEYLFDMIHKEENEKHRQFLHYIDNRFVFDSKRNVDNGIVPDRIITAIEFVIKKIKDD